MRCQVNYDNMQVKTDQKTGSSEEANLAMQLLDDEVMDAKMANFIGIHNLNDIVCSDETKALPPIQDNQYTDPITGAHFEYHDLV